VLLVSLIKHTVCGATKNKWQYNSEVSAALKHVFVIFKLNYSCMD
jgi:hypothetical protein